MMQGFFFSHPEVVMNTVIRPVAWPGEGVEAPRGDSVAFETRQDLVFARCNDYRIMTPSQFRLVLSLCSFVSQRSKVARRSSELGTISVRSQHSIRGWMVIGVLLHWGERKRSSGANNSTTWKVALHFKNRWYPQNFVFWNGGSPQIWKEIKALKVMKLQEPLNDHGLIVIVNPNIPIQNITAGRDNFCKM